MPEYVLELKNVRKEFPGVLALDNVNLQIKAGEVHALCGENGAGKSTLIKIICGMYPYGSYSGEIYMDGKLQKYKGIADAENAGVVCIQQELALIDEMSVQENIFLTDPPAKRGVIDWDEMYIKTREVLQRVSLNIDPATKTGVLGVGQKQLVEIARALVSHPKILLLDEPTASLTDKEVEILLSIVRKLKDQGVTCIYISHKLDEIYQISDTISILRDGQMVYASPAEELTKEQLIVQMVGRPLGQQFPREEHTPGSEVMRVEHYTVYDPVEKHIKRVDDVSFAVRKGEILGVSGLMGAGRTELFSSIFGSYPGRHTGKVTIKDSVVDNKSPAQAIKNGYCMLSEDRKQEGLNLVMSIRENATLASLKKFSRVVVDKGLECVKTQEQIKKLHIKTSDMEEKVMNLSGGNQQKVAIAKWLLAGPDILVVDEPTRGVDVGAKLEIYKILNSLVDAGIAVVMISSELEEILGMSDRIMIMNEGKFRGELDYREATQESIMSIALFKAEAG